jgi:signal transduction histidine kinase
MKSDNTFILEHAGWPAFIVDGSGLVRHANVAAINLFGPKLDGEAMSLSALFAEGSEPAEQLLARCDRQATSTVTLSFLPKASVPTVYPVSICPMRQDQQSRFLLQLLPERTEAGLMEIPVEGNTQMWTRDNTKMWTRDNGGTNQRPKLDRAAQLTRTVALDFNNALTSILGHASLVLSKAEPDHPWRKSLDEIRRAANKAAEITHQLANFSRSEKDVSAPSGTNMNDVLRRVSEKFKMGAGITRQWSLQLENPLYKTRFDESKLEQAFSRLLENALEATSDGAEIDVASRNCDLAQATTEGTMNLNPGSYVCVEISDKGAGIDAKHLPRIFEPFFTTKEGHRGLGLVWVYGIVSNHGGGVAVTSEPGKGTSARIYLPATKSVLLDSPADNEPSDLPQTILVVDDEELLLTMGRDILSSFGYRVLTANAGAAALETLAAAAPPVDLVITDLVMPQMNGRELMGQIHRRYPNLPIICTSGYAGSSNVAEEEVFLEKPFTTQELLARVRQVLKPVKKP